MLLKMVKIVLGSFILVSLSSSQAFSRTHWVEISQVSAESESPTYKKAIEDANASAEAFCLMDQMLLVTIHNKGYKMIHYEEDKSKRKTENLEWSWSWKATVSGTCYGTHSEGSILPPEPEAPQRESFPETESTETKKESDEWDGEVQYFSLDQYYEHN